MAGEIRGGNHGPKPVRKARKMWSLQDRSVVSVHLLKANLAEDGCEEAQLDVAKRLLSDSRSDLVDAAGQCENARLAVYWFIKSSEQGNDEATRYLQECYDSGHGITCQNILDVQVCLATPRNEKLTFKAARLLYTKLCNGEDFITTIQLQARLDTKKYKSKVTFDSTSPKKVDICSDDSNDDNDKYYSPFGSPSEVKDTTSGIGSWESEDLINPLKSNQHLDKGGIKLTMEDLLNVAAKFNEGELPPVSIQNGLSTGTNRLTNWNFLTPWTAYVFQLILFTFALDFITAVSALHVALIYLSLYSSANFILMKVRQQTFQDWSEVFRSVLKEDNSWTDKIALARFDQKYCRPYLATSFTCSFLLLFFNSHFFLKCVITSTILLGLNFRGIKKREHFWSQLFYWCFIGTLILKSPFVSEWSWNRSVEPPETQDWSNKFYEVLPEVVTVTMIIFVILIARVVQRFKQRGRIADQSFLHKGHYGGIFKALFLLLGINLADCFWNFSEPEVIGSVLMLITILTVYKNFNRKLRLKGIVSTILVIVAAWLTVVAYKEVGTDHWGKGQGQPNQVKTVTWLEYEQNCHRPAWKIRSVAETEMHCRAQYLNANVNWTGKLSYVKLHEVTSGHQGKTTYQDQRTHQGQQYTLDLDNNQRDLDVNGVQFEVLMSIGDKEDLVSGSEIEWNWFDLFPSIFSRQSETLAFAPVLLYVTTQNLDARGRVKATNRILSYRSGDILEFGGKLTRNVGGFKPEVGVVESLQCLSCASMEDRYRNNHEKIVFTEQNPMSIWDQMKATMRLSNALNLLNGLNLNISNYIDSFKFLTNHLTVIN